MKVVLGKKTKAGDGNGEKTKTAKTSPLPLAVQAIDVKEGAFTDAMKEFEKLIDRGVVASRYSKSDLGAGGAAKGIQGLVAGISAVVGVQMSLIEFLHSTLLSFRVCCIEKIESSIKGDRPQLEDEASPEVILGKVQAHAGTDDTKFSKDLAKLGASILAEGLGVADAYGDATQAILPKKITGEAVSSLGDVLGEILTWAGAMVLKKYATSTIEKLLNASGEFDLDKRTWVATLNSDSVAGNKWLEIETKGYRGESDILRDVGTAASPAWELRKNAYEYGVGLISLEQDTKKFPAGTWAVVRGDTLEVKLEPIEIRIDPLSKFVDERGAEYSFEVQIENAEHTLTNEVQASAGTVTDQVAPKADDRPKKSFTWKSPMDKDKYPVDFTIESTSNMTGLRGRLGDEAPVRRATAFAYHRERVTIHGVPCVRTGTKHTFDAEVVPDSAELEWSVENGTVNAGKNTHKANYQAPSSPGEAKLVARMKGGSKGGDSETKDTQKLAIRKSCVCTYQFQVPGYVSESYVHPQGEKGKPISASAHEKRGLLEAGYGHEKTALNLGARDLSLSDLRKGSDTFSGKISYVKGQAEVEAHGAPTIRARWRGEKSMAVTLRATGIVQACTTCLKKKQGRRGKAPFNLTLNAPVTRFEKDGTYTIMECNGDVTEVDQLPQGTPSVPGSGE